MTKKNVMVFLLLLIAFAISFLVLMFDMFGEENPPQIYNISVIVRGKNSDSWENIKQGADQAASEMNVELSFITLTEENSISEQISLLQREYSSGADAIILSAADSWALAGPLERLAGKIPVVCIESPIASDAMETYISGDDYAMGKQLAEEIIASGNSRKRLALVDRSTNCKNVALRRQGLMSVLAQIGGEVIHWEIPDETAAASQEFARRLAEKKADVIVTLDTAALESAAQAVVESGSSYLDLFGIGSTSKVASYIEQDVVTATVVQNDFSIGYLGVKTAVDALLGVSQDKTIQVEHRVVNWSNMYDPENQRLLFPFIR